MLNEDRHFKLIWSKEDQEYVGLCYEYSSLSWLDPDPVQALKGIMKLVEETDFQEKLKKDFSNDIK